MAIEVASLRAVLSLDKDNFESGLTGVKRQLSDFGKGFAAQFNIPTDAFGLGAAAAGVFTSALSSSIAAAREATAINKDLEQTIRSTGGVAGVTADAARDLAEELSNVTNFEDDAIVKGEAMLLTFTKIGSDVFPRATETMLDMAQKFGSMESASIQLGKALNDPISGISALTRVGVDFSKAQKEQIKGFMAVNDIASAQKVILDELATEFGGQARALVDPWIQLQNALGNIGESVGMGIIPVLNAIAQAAIPAAKAIGEMAPMAEALGKSISTSLGPGLEVIGPGLNALSEGFTAANEGMNQLQAALGLSQTKFSGFTIILAPVTATLQGVGYVAKGVGATFTFLGETTKALASIVTTFKNGWTTLSASMSGINSVGARVMQVWTGISSAMAGVVVWVNQVIAAWNRMVTTLSQQISIPDWLVPGSPTPFEMGLRGITDAINSMPSVGSAMGGRPVANSTGVGGVTNHTTNLNMGGQNFSFGGPGSQNQAITEVIRLLRYKLETATA